MGEGEPSTDRQWFILNIFVERLWRSVKYEDIYRMNHCLPSERISNDGRGEGGSKTLFSVLQQRATSSIAWLPNTGGSVHRENRVGTGIHPSTLIHKKERKKEPEKQVIKTKRTVLTMGSTLMPFDLYDTPSHNQDAH